MGRQGMELARLVAFAFGVYLSGAFFALAAVRILERRGVDVRGGTWIRSLAARFTRAASAPHRSPPAPSPGPVELEPRAKPAPAASSASAESGTAGTAGTAGGAHGPPEATLDADDALAAWLAGDAFDTQSPRADPAADSTPFETTALPEEPTRPVVTADAAHLERELQDARLHRLALELELSERVPLSDQLGWLARRVEQLEIDLEGHGGSHGNGVARLEAARALLFEHAHEAGRERARLAEQLGAARAERADRDDAERARLGALVVRLAELDTEVDRLASAVTEGAQERAELLRDVERASSLVRSERELSTRIRALLAGFQLPPNAG